MQRQLIDYIRRPDAIDKEGVAHLRRLVEQYPYFHSARIVLLQALYRLHDPAYNNELRASSVMVPNRQAIFHLSEEKNYTVEEERKKFDHDTLGTDEEDVTANLIDQFLGSLPQEQASSTPMPIDATQDYIGFLLQSERSAPQAAETPQVEVPPMAGNDLIDDFLESGISRITFKREDTAAPTVNRTPEAPVAPQPEVASANEAEEEPQSNGFLTETLAGIYIKQGKYENAAKIIRQIYLNNPKKSRYFADQLRFLEKLIINSKNK